MKKIKFLMPMATIASTVAIIAPLASCSKTVVEEGIKVTLAPESADEIKIKESKCELNKDSTITLEIPLTKAAKITYIIVGTTRIETSAYTFDGETITIKAAAMAAKNVEVFVTAKNVVGLTAKVEKTFEALESFKAADLKVYPVYDDETVGTKALVWNEGYKIYDPLEEEVEDFATTGYTFDRDEAREGSVEFVVEFAPYTRYTTTIKVSVTPRMEPKSINAYTCVTVINKEKITPEDILVDALMTDETRRELAWGSDYTIWDGETEITDFGTNGYTFTSTGSKNLIVKTVENPDEAYQTINFKVIPASLKYATILTNNGDGEAGVTWTYTPRVSKTLNTNIQYSKDNGDTWNDAASGTEIPLGPNETIAFKGNNPKGLTVPDPDNPAEDPYEKNNINIISKEPSGSDKEMNVNLSGSLLGLLNDNGKQKTPETLPDVCFYGLFEGSCLKTVSKSFLNDIKLTKYCFKNMLQECKELILPPKLPALSLEEGCYMNLFRWCDKLLKAPELPATTLAKSCYESMFCEDSNLIYLPELPAEELAEGCYELMFESCLSLKVPPKLSSIKLARACYNRMFSNCTSLEEAPELPAEELVQGCYSTMFYNCTKLKKAPVLKSKNLAENCYNGMFNQCSALEEAPELPATTIKGGCYQYMFAECTSLKKAPELPAEKMEYWCYKNMFDHCTSLEIAPKLPATILAGGCYEYMFNECSSLKQAPELPAEELEDQCYNGMFFNCKSLYVTDKQNDHKILTTVPGKKWREVMKKECYLNMFTGVNDKPYYEYDLAPETTYYWVEH